MDSVASYGNLSIAIDDLDNRIVRRGMLAQALPCIEREQRDSARFRIDQGLTYYRISRIFDKRFCINRFTFVHFNIAQVYTPNICLLYTSDAADDLLCVDLGG